MDLIIVCIYSFLGVVFMILGNMLVDLIIPSEFPKEIKNGNTAIGVIMASISISIALIFRSSVISFPQPENVKLSLLEDLSVVAIYFLLGVFILIAGYVIISCFYRKLDLNAQILKGNVAAGLVIGGLFIGLATIISGVIV